MTEKQKRFCYNYMESGNSTEAYIKAGYKDSGSVTANASRLLATPEIKAFINEISEQIKSERIADIKEIQERLTQIIRGLTVEEVIVSELVGGGKTKSRVIEKHPSHRDVIWACDKLLKTLGAYSQRIELEGAVPVVISGGEALED